MASLNRQNGGCSSKKNGIGKEYCATRVSSNTNVLNDTSGSSHSGDIGETGSEVELAAGDGFFTKSPQSSLKNCGVGSLVCLDLFELFDWNLRGSETSTDEIRLLEAGEGFLVECRFELLEDIGEFEDRNIDCRTFAIEASRRCRDQVGSDESDESGGEAHDDEIERHCQGLGWISESL